MILDNRTAFANPEALNTGAAGTYLVGDVYDLEDLRDIGNGEALYLVIQMETTATSGGSATASFQLASDAQAAIATDGSATTHVQTAQYAVADMTAGTRIIAVKLPLEGPAYERYLGILQTTGTAAFTAGAIHAFLTTQPFATRQYPEGQN